MARLAFVSCVQCSEVWFGALLYRVRSVCLLCVERPEVWFVRVTWRGVVWWNGAVCILCECFAMKLHLTGFHVVAHVRIWNCVCVRVRVCACSSGVVLCPCWGVLICLTFAVIIIVNLTLVYLPILNDYTHFCVREHGNGTFLTQNFYSMSYNYASRDGVDLYTEGMYVCMSLFVCRRQWMGCCMCMCVCLYA